MHRWRILLEERARTVDWRSDFVLASRAGVTAVLAASPYAFTWVQVTSIATVSRLDVALALACVLSSVPLYAAAMKLSGARHSWRGGTYVAAFTVLAGAWVLMYRGLDSITSGTWMGAAGCAATIYVMGSGHPGRAK